MEQDDNRIEDKAITTQAGTLPKEPGGFIGYEVLCIESMF